MNVTVKGLRDLFFLLVGAAILYNQFWQREDPSPLGVFVALFLFGLIPAFRADETTVGPLQALLALLGGRAAPDRLAEQEARADRAARVARDRAAVREAMAERAEREERESRSSPPESRGPDSR